MYSSSMKFGRIPPETIELFERSVREVRQQITAALPPAASADVRAYTIEAVLDVIFKDWRINENTSGLEQEDLNDLTNFVKLAASLAQPDLNGDGFPVFQATLKGLLSDWLYNWNASDDPDPPGPAN